MRTRQAMGEQNCIIIHHLRSCCTLRVNAAKVRNARLTREVSVNDSALAKHIFGISASQQRQSQPKLDYLPAG